MTATCPDASSSFSSKPAPSVAPGMWVLLESMLVTRHVSRPWQVVRVSGKRVYLRSFVRDPVTHELEIREERHVLVDTIRAVLPNEATAQALFERDCAAAREFERITSEARAAFDREYAQALTELQASPLPKAADAPPEPEPAAAAPVAAAHAPGGKATKPARRPRVARTGT